MGGGTEREFEVSRCKLEYREWINNKDLLYSTGNYIQFPVINHNGKAYKKECIGTSLAVQQLRFHASTAGGMGLIPGQGTKFPNAAQCGPPQKKRKKKKRMYIDV